MRDPGNQVEKKVQNLNQSGGLAVVRFSPRRHQSSMEINERHLEMSLRMRAVRIFACTLNCEKKQSNHFFKFYKSWMRFQIH